jgi:hypothetical protein
MLYKERSTKMGTILVVTKLEFALIPSITSHYTIVITKHSPKTNGLLVYLEDALQNVQVKTKKNKHK